MTIESDWKTKTGLAKMLKGGVIMDVVNPEQAKIAENAMCSHGIGKGGVARMSDPVMIKGIQNSVTIPVMAKVRIGHFMEAQILQSLKIDYIDESEVLTPADDYHIDKHLFNVPFVCGCRDLGEALRRISEGAAMIRTKGEAGTGNIIEAVRHARAVKKEIKMAQSLDAECLYGFAKKIGASYDLLKSTVEFGRLPVVNFAAGGNSIGNIKSGIATPADAALMMQLGMDGVFVGSGIFKSGDPVRRAKAIVMAVSHFNDATVLSNVSCDLGDAMMGLSGEFEKYSSRGYQ